MDNPTPIKSLKDEVLQNIKEGHIKMRPKWQFILRAVLFVTGTALLLLAILYLASFIIFTLHQTGAWFGPVFGSRGWLAFFRAMPWMLILLAVVFIALLETFVKHRPFAYRTPILYSVLGIILLAVLCGGLIAPLHRDPFRSAGRNQLPFAGPLYRSYGMPPLPDTHRGTVVSTTSLGFIMTEPRGRTSTVLISNETRMPTDKMIELGETVVVFGDDTPTGIQAFGVREISE